MEEESRKGESRSFGCELYFGRYGNNIRLCARASDGAQSQHVARFLPRDRRTMLASSSIRRALQRTKRRKKASFATETERERENFISILFCGRSRNKIERKSILLLFYSVEEIEM